MSVTPAVPRVAAVIVAAVGAIVVAGCVRDPLAPLIPLPDRPATVLPSEAPETTADGFANILADPATVAGLPRSQKDIRAEEAALEHARARAQAATRGIETTLPAGVVAAKGRNHVAAARAEIQASGRPRTGLPPLEPLPLDRAADVPASPPVDEGEPLDPDAPLPRAVGVPPFGGDPPPQ